MLFDILIKIILTILKIFRNILGVDKIYKSYLYPNSDAIPPDVHYCLILGAKLTENDCLTPMLKARLDAAIELFKKRPSLIFILSGDGSKRISNDVHAMYTYLKERSSIPDAQIIFDNEGYSTLDSLHHITPEIDAGGFILLTSEFHMPRSVYLCHRLGLHPYALHLPSISPDLHFRCYDRELVALVKNWYILAFGKPQFGKGLHYFGFLLALLSGKVTHFFLKITKHPQSDLPGQISLQICPSLLQYLTRGSSVTIIVNATENASLRAIATNLLSHHNFFAKHQSLTIICSLNNFYKVASRITSQDVCVVINGFSEESSAPVFSETLTRNYILCGIDFLPNATIYINESDPIAADLKHDITNPVLPYNNFKL